MTFSVLAGKSSYHPLVLIHAWIEKLAIRSADRILATMEYGWKRVVELGQPKEKFVCIPNGWGDQTGEQQHVVLPDDAVRAFARPELKFVYIGSIGFANALDLILEAARLRQDDHVHFYFVGDGAYKDELEKKVAALALKNVSFVNPVAKPVVTLIMQQADALLISWHESPLYRYGTSANKISEYLSSGRPIIQAYSGNGDLVTRAGAGFTVPAGDADAFAHAVLRIANMDAKARKELGENGKRYARENLTFSVLAEKLAQLVQ